MNATASQALMPQPLIRVTPTNAALSNASEQLILRTFELIAYSQDLESTRLHLTGHRVIEVKETTQEIDLLVRAAAQGLQLPAPVASQPARPPVTEPLDFNAAA